MYFTNLTSNVGINLFLIFANFGKVQKHASEVFDTTAVGPRANDHNTSTLESLRFMEYIIQNLISCYACVML